MSVADIGRDLTASQSRLLDGYEARLFTAWATTWDALEAELLAELEAIFDGHQLGHLPAWQLAKSRRLAQALKTAHDEMKRILDEVGQEYTGTLPGEVQAVLDAHKRMGRAQTAGIGIDFVDADPAALDEIVKRSTGQITAAHLTLPGEIEALMRQELIRGVAVGDNPRAAARRMVQAAGRRFAGGMTRAAMIARTEFMDATRRAGYEADKANADLLSGWVWVAQLNGRTCPACVAMHGTEHPIEEPGPNGHHNCRCARVPKTKTWAELGIKTTAPESQFFTQTGEDWYNELPEDQKRQVMGDTRYRLLQDGTISFSDLAKTRHTDGWRDSIHPAPIKDLEKK